MVLGQIASAIPNIFGGFAPFPNTIATALLAYQSEAIGFGFGIKFQYSKRLIGALTNEEFNGLSVSAIGNIVEAHNSELIQRMKDQMPKWIDIQKSFIEASVEVEVAKANRTPSAMAEIINALVGAGFKEITEQLKDFDDGSNESIQTLTLISPLLALIAILSRGDSTIPPPSDEPPSEEPPDGTTRFSISFQYDEWVPTQESDGSYTAVITVERTKAYSLTCNEIKLEIAFEHQEIQKEEDKGPSATGSFVATLAYSQIKIRQQFILGLQQAQAQFNCSI